MYIVPLNSYNAHWFKKINLQWINHFFKVDAQEIDELENPIESIVQKGGYVYFAKYQNKIVGCFALKKITDTTFELAKMGVLKEYQGKKIGVFLVSNAIKKAKELGTESIILYSNTILEKAIYLYKKYGFIEVENDNKNLKRANIKMELKLPLNNK